MLKPINRAAHNMSEKIISSGRCGDVCVWCDEPFDDCSQCDAEPCIVPDYI